MYVDAQGLETDMEWLQLVGSLKWWVSFAKEPYKRDDILQKRRVILRCLPIVATSYSRPTCEKQRKKTWKEMYVQTKREL